MHEPPTLPAPESTPPPLTQLIASARQGDRDAAAALFTLLYEDLRRIARSKLRQHQTMTLLDTTSLVHESYMKLLGAGTLPVEDRRHFFAYAARVMRSVIVDFARARAAERRGGDADHLVLDTVLSDKLAAPETDVLRVHEALDVLAQADARLAQVVEMRFFGGLSEAEIAEALDVSERTVRRDWEKARLLLLAALE
jgi:RNA polymerase sigma factor (TIGR02999 family)